MTTDSTPALASLDETIASIREGRTSHPLHSVRLDESGYDGAMVRVTTAGAVLSPGDDAVIAAERAAAGVSLAGVENDIASLSKRIGYLNEQLGRVQYDPRTGTEVSVVPKHIAEAHRTELASLQEELGVANQTRNAVLSRKAAEAAKAREIDEVETAEAEWVQHDPRRAQLLKDAKERLEAEQLAAWSLGRRYRVG